jgi:hypothetical protein
MNNREKVAHALKKNPNRSLRDIARKLGLHHTTVMKYADRIKAGESDPQRGSPTKDEGLEDDHKEGTQHDYGDKVGSVTSKSRTIQTQAQLLAAAEVDLDVWKVVRCVINKWEVCMREPATTIGGAGKKALLQGEEGNQRAIWTRGSDKPLHENLFQVKVFLERKTPPEHAVSVLYDKLSKRAAKDPLFPHIKREKLTRKEGKQSLEIDIMDPHLGMLCNYPEADAPQDMDSACNMVMGAMEDLLGKAERHGKFEEVFLPIGNDFVHCDNVWHTTTAGTGQPEAMDWHAVFVRAEELLFLMVERLRKVAPVFLYQIPGNHSRQSDFSLARILQAGYRGNDDVTVDASSSPYKFHRAGKNLIGFEHGHSVAQIRLAALMANERPEDWAATEYREWHLGDQHRKGSSKPSSLEEQGVSVEYVPGLTAPNSWHRIKSFSHQQRGAMAYVWDWEAGPVGRFQCNISKYSHKLMARKK